MSVVYAFPHGSHLLDSGRWGEAFLSCPESCWKLQKGKLMDSCRLMSHRVSGPWCKLQPEAPELVLRVSGLQAQVMWAPLLSPECVVTFSWLS